MSSQSQTIDLHPDVKIHALLSNPPAFNPSAPSALPTVLLLHFWGGSSRTWSFVNPLVAAHYPTIALDFRGWGYSTGPDKPDGYSISNLADDVERVISTLDINDVILVGISMGAKVAQLVAARGKVGANLHGLVLVSPAPATPLSLPPEMREQQLHAYDNAESAGFVATNILTVSYHGRSLPGFVVEDMLRGNRWTRQAWPAYGMGEDVSEGVSEISVPVLVLAAENDRVEPVERVRSEVVARIPGARMEIVQGSGHLSPLDKPEVVADNLLKFVGQTQTGFTGGE